MMDLLAAASLIPLAEIIGDEISVARVARTFRALRILRATRAAAMALKTEAALKRANQARVAAAKLEAGAGDRGGGTAAAADSKSLLEATLLERGNVKMLLGVLILLMGLSFIDYSESDRAAESGLWLVDVGWHGAAGTAPRNNRSTTEGAELAAALASQYRSGIEHDAVSGEFRFRRLVYLEVSGDVWVSGSAESGDDARMQAVRRPKELLEVTAGNATHERRSISRIDLKPMYDVQNLNSMYSTTFSIFVIIGWAMSFRRDYHVFVLRPVRRMVETLREMTSNPRLAIAKLLSGVDKRMLRNESPRTGQDIFK